MKLIFSIACDRARERPDGKLDVEGIFNELYAPGFPAQQEQMTVVFVVEWEPEEAGQQPLRADLLDEADEKVLTIQGHTDVAERGSDRAPAQTRLVLPLEQVVFPHPGRYRFQLEVGDEVLRAFSVYVTERDETEVPDPAS